FRSFHCVFVCLFTALTESSPLSYTTLFRSFVRSTLIDFSNRPSTSPSQLSFSIDSFKSSRSCSLNTTPRPERLARCFKNAPAFRSEEHTSELQSRENLVCRLLLEKKKRNRR